MSDAQKGIQQGVRGNNRLLIGGVAAVTAGLGIFWYAQKANLARKETTPHPGAIPTWEYRLGQEELSASNSDQHLAQRSSGTDVRTQPNNLPTRDNDDESGSKGVGASYLNATQGKGTEDHQNPKSEPTPQKQKDEGSEIASKKRDGPEFDEQRHGSDKN